MNFKEYYNLTESGVIKKIVQQINPFDYPKTAGGVARALNPFGNEGLLGKAAMAARKADDYLKGNRQISKRFPIPIESPNYIESNFKGALDSEIMSGSSSVILKPPSGSSVGPASGYKIYTLKYDDFNTHTPTSVDFPGNFAGASIVASIYQKGVTYYSAHSYDLKQAIHAVRDHFPHIVSEFLNKSFEFGVN